MPQDNVLSLNAFGELIEPPKKREYPGEPPLAKGIEVPVDFPQQIIPLKRVTPDAPDYYPGSKTVLNPFTNVPGVSNNPASLPPISKNKEGREMLGSKQASQVASKVLINMAQTKLLHWQTKSLAEHESLDKLFEGLVDLGDELVESVMGKYGRPELGGDECSLTLTNYENPDSPDGLPKFLSNLDNCFRNECMPLFPEEKDPEIHNLIHEILGLIDKISYLLTLRK